MMDDEDDILNVDFDPIDLENVDEELLLGGRITPPSLNVTTTGSIVELEKSAESVLIAENSPLVAENSPLSAVGCPDEKSAEEEIVTTNENPSPKNCNVKLSPIKSAEYFTTQEDTKNESSGAEEDEDPDDEDRNRKKRDQRRLKFTTEQTSVIQKRFFTRTGIPDSLDDVKLPEFKKFDNRRRDYRSRSAQNFKQRGGGSPRTYSRHPPPSQHRHHHQHSQHLRYLVEPQLKSRSRSPLLIRHQSRDDDNDANKSRYEDEANKSRDGDDANKSHDGDLNKSRDGDANKSRDGDDANKSRDGDDANKSRDIDKNKAKSRDNDTTNKETAAVPGGGVGGGAIFDAANSQQRSRHSPVQFPGLRGRGRGTVLLNPHFKGTVRADPHVRLAWDVRQSELIAGARGDLLTSTHPRIPLLSIPPLSLNMLPPTVPPPPLPLISSLGGGFKGQQQPISGGGGGVQSAAAAIGQPPSSFQQQQQQSHVIARQSAVMATSVARMGPPTLFSSVSQSSNITSSSILHPPPPTKSLFDPTKPPPPLLASLTRPPPSLIGQPFGDVIKANKHDWLGLTEDFLRKLQQTNKKQQSLDRRVLSSRDDHRPPSPSPSPSPPPTSRRTSTSANNNNNSSGGASGGSRKQQAADHIRRKYRISSSGSISKLKSNTEHSSSMARNALIQFELAQARMDTKNLYDEEYLRKLEEQKRLRDELNKRKEIRRQQEIAKKLETTSTVAQKRTSDEDNVDPDSKEEISLNPDQKEPTATISRPKKIIRLNSGNGKTAAVFTKTIKLNEQNSNSSSNRDICLTGKQRERLLLQSGDHNNNVGGGESQKIDNQQQQRQKSITTTRRIVLPPSDVTMTSSNRQVMTSSLLSANVKRGSSVAMATAKSDSAAAVSMATTKSASAVAMATATSPGRKVELRRKLSISRTSTSSNMKKDDVPLINRLERVEWSAGSGGNRKQQKR